MERAKSASGPAWAIATPHEAASGAGAEAFTLGGNAIDAALSAAVALTVAYPHNCSVGGDLFALVRRPDGDVTAVNASGAAPAGLTAEAVKEIVAHMPERGPMTVTVPGAVDGWHALAGLGSRLGFPAAVEPAVALAADGVPVSTSLARAISAERTILLADPGLASIFLPTGKTMREGDLLRQPALARTLQAIASEGPGAVYHDEIGRSWIRMLRARGSPMTVDDLAEYRSELTPPLASPYRDLDVLVIPPNSQGVVLLQILAVIEGLGIDPDPMGSDAAVMAEIFRRASADRDRYVADPRFGPVAVDELLSDENLRQIADDVRLHVGSAGTTNAPTSGDTVAVVAIDAEGWVVSLIQSTYESFGSGILDPATGVILHNRGACFSLDLAHPNVLEGRKRPMHTLMPVLVLRHGVTAAVSGSMGGGAQPQINAMSILRLFDLEMAVRDVLQAPRWVVGGLGVDAGSRTIVAESRVPPQTIAAFEEAGFEVVQVEARSEMMGHAQVIRCGQRRFDVATDPRADGSALAG